MKKLLKKIFILSIILIIQLNIVSFKTPTSQKTNNYLKYTAIALGVSYNDIVDMYNEKSDLEAFEQIIEYNIRETAELYDSEKYDSLDKTVNIDLEAFSKICDIELELLYNHLNYFGNYRYSKIIESYKQTYNINYINPVQQATSSAIQKSSAKYNRISESDWQDFYSVAHTGNIFLTKDSTSEIISSTYRHGHAGVIQKHTSNPKYITEATGDQSNTYNEVMCRPLETGWRNRVSMCILYPNTTQAKRESAGNHTWYYAEGNGYTYESMSYKTNMRNSNYTKLSCAGLAYRVYYFIANYDIIPQVNDITIIKPKHIYESPNMLIKHDENNILYEINFELFDWGFDV